jgi:hypothetical protein
MKWIFLIYIFFNLKSFGVEYDDHSFEKFNHPERHFSIIVTKAGYYPDQLIAFEGEKIRLFVTSTLTEPQCVLLKGHKLYLSAKVGKVTEGEVLLENAGEYNYYCPGFDSVGKITVLGKSEKKKKNYLLAPKNRSVAGEVVEETWVPKE